MHAFIIVAPITKDKLEFFANDFSCGETGLIRHSLGYIKVGEFNRWDRSGNVVECAKRMANTLINFGYDATVVTDLDDTTVEAAIEDMHGVSMVNKATEAFYKEQGHI
jgi:hypothetical protein